MATRPINLFDKVASIQTHWTPEHILTLDSSHSIKIATIKGEFIWHSHPDSDEVFYCISGGPFRIDLDGGKAVELKVGDVFMVPKGLQHRPVAEVETGILLIEKVGTVNTGDRIGHERTVHVQEQ